MKAQKAKHLKAHLQSHQLTPISMSLKFVWLQNLNLYTTYEVFYSCHQSLRHDTQLK